jgi:GNAT superfamily N-acetyltransferase
LDREPGISIQDGGWPWLAADPLLAAPVASAGCGVELIMPGPSGQLAAAATCEHWLGAPGSLELAFGAAARFQLTIHVAAPEAAPGALDRMLSVWRDHLADVPEAAGADTAAVIAWPSRAITESPTFLRRGFTVRTVLAARPAGPAPVTQTDPGIQVRQAGPADLDTVTSLGLDLIRFDAHFGSLVERPDTAAALRHDAAAALADPDPWVWVAERAGTPAGMLYAQQPEQAQWVAPMVALAPAAYVDLMHVQPGERGRGIGHALASHLRQKASAAGVAAMLLHYQLLNPLSGPFWSRQGYRPLWNIWELRPARTMDGRTPYKAEW